MLKSYLTVAMRNLWKFRNYSFINLFGLAVGMTACLIIYFFVRYESNFDRFHEKASQIYRVTEYQSFNGITPQHVALSMYPMGETMTRDLPEVIDFTRSWRRQDLRFNDGQKNVILPKTLAVDSSFLSIFDFHPLEGQPEAMLREPYSIVLTESYASHFFSGENIIGKTIALDDTIAYHITGIIADVPENSHLQFDALVSIGSIPLMDWMEGWDANILVTYLLLNEDADVESVVARFPAMVEKYGGEGASQTIQVDLQPLTDIHLGSTHITHDYQNYKKFDRNYVYLFSALAVFIMLIACINFMNITAARSASRYREVGIRKTIGARRLQLAGQFIGESVLMALFALAVALLMAKLLFPYVSELSGRPLSFNFSDHPFVLPAMLLIGIITGAISGVYPALIISAYQPASTLKSEFKGTHSKTRFRNILVVIQFSIAIGLIVGTLLVVQQLHFLNKHTLGFNKENVLLLPMNRTANQNYETLRTKFMQHSAILDVTASGQRLGNNIHQMSSRYEGFDEGFSISVLNVDLNYPSFYNIEILDGRTFQTANTADKQNSYILNETLAKKLNWESPVGKGARLNWLPEMGTVIGLAKDFNFNSLHHRVEPLLITSQYWEFDEMSVRVSSGNIEGALAHIENTWQQLVTDYPFEYAFLDEHFEQLYLADRQTSDVIMIIAGLAIIIACLGLFGLSAISTELRTKEIGIRKVLGASVWELIYMLCKGFIGLVFLAFIIAIPLTYIVMGSWLQNFAYHIDMSLITFFLAGILALIIALFTVGYHAISTARANPVQALRYE